MDKLVKAKRSIRIIYFSLAVIGLFLFCLAMPVAPAYADTDSPAVVDSSADSSDGGASESGSSGADSSDSSPEASDGGVSSDEGSGSAGSDGGSGSETGKADGSGASGSESSGTEGINEGTSEAEASAGNSNGDTESEASNSESTEGENANIEDEGRSSEGSTPDSTDGAGDVIEEAGPSPEGTKGETGATNPLGDNLEDGVVEETADGKAEEETVLEEDEEELGVMGGTPPIIDIIIHGTVYDSLTREAIEGATIVFMDSNSQTYTHSDIIPGNSYSYLFANTSDIPEGKYTINASAEGYETYSWTFDLNHPITIIIDGTSVSIPVNHDIDFYLAPTLREDQPGVSSPSGISGSWVSMNDEVVIDKDLIYPGYDLDIAAGISHTWGNESPFKKITINDRVTITTREIGESSDYLDASSTGDSGNLNIIGSQVEIGKNVEILAQATDGFTAGDINITALATGGTDILDILLANVDHPQAIITVGEDSVIKGKDITFDAKADTTVVFPDNNEDELTLLDTLFINKLMEMGVGFLEGFSLVGGVTVSQATSLIKVGENSLIEAVNFDALASSYIKAAASPTAIAAGVAVGVGISDAQVIVLGKIITTEDCTLKSLADNTFIVQGKSGGIAGLSAGIAVSILHSTSKVAVEPTAELQVEGDLTLEAKTIDRNYTLASSTTGENGKVGVAIAVVHEYGETEAFLAGDIDVGGDIAVRALMYEEETDKGKGVYAVAGANTDSTGSVTDDFTAAVKTKITSPIKNFITKQIGDFFKTLLGKKDEVKEKTGSNISSFETAAATAVCIDNNHVTARISVGAMVKSRGAITVEAKAQTQPRVLATGWVEESDEKENPSGEGGANPDPDPGAGDDNDGTKFAGSAAVVVGIYGNVVKAYIGERASVDAAKNLNIKAEYNNDYEIIYDIDLLTYLFGEFLSTSDGNKTIIEGDIIRVEDGHKAGGEAGNLYRYKGTDPLNTNLGLVDFEIKDLWENLGAEWQYRGNEFLKALGSHLDTAGLGIDEIGNFWVQSSAAGAKVSLCGTVSLIIRDNEVLAYIDKDAQVNQKEDAVYRTGNQNVKVSSVLIDEIIYFSGNIELPGLSFDKKNWKVQKDLGGYGCEAETAAAGGSLVIFIQNNKNKAQVKDNVLLFANKIDVTADTKVLNVVIGAAGGKSGKFGLEGTANLIILNNETLAAVANSARLVVPGKVTIKANDHTYVIDVAGVITEGGNIAVGGSAGINLVIRDTQALIGVLENKPEGNKPGTGEFTINTDGDVLVEALNDGFIISIGIAGVYSGESSAEGEGEGGGAPGGKEAPQGGGSYGVGISAVVVANNMQDKALAYIRQATLHSTEVVISAHNRTKVIAVGGSVAIVNKNEDTSAALAGSLAFNRIDNKTKAFIDKSDVVASGDIEIKAEAAELIISLSASGAGATSSKSGSVAGQVSLNSIKSEVIAAIFNQSEVKGENITLTANDSTMIIAVAGALAYGGKAGIGAAVAINDIPLEVLGSVRNAVKAYIEDSDVTADGNLKLTAEVSNLIVALAAAIGGSKEGMAAAASITVNTIATDTAAYIIGKKAAGTGINCTGDVILKASDNSSIYSMAGAASFSKSGSAVGAAIAFNLIANSVTTYVKDTSLTSASLVLNSAMNASIMNITAGGSMAEKAVANGSVSTNTVVGEVKAYIDNSIVIASAKVELQAVNNADIASIAGAIGLSKECAVGAALAVNYIGGYGTIAAPYQVAAYIDNSRITVIDGELLIYAHSNAIIRSISAVGSFSSGKAAVNGAVSLNYINMNVLAYIQDCKDGGTPGNEKGIFAQGDILLKAVDNNAVTVLAGNIAGADKAGVGAAISVVFIGSFTGDPFADYKNNRIVDYNPEGGSGEPEDLPSTAYEYPEFDFKTLNSYSQVAAYIENSKVESENGGISLKATANAIIFNIAAGAAIGGDAGVQGSTALNYLAAEIAALINNSIIEAAGDILLEARNLRRSDIPLTALEPEKNPGNASEYKWNPGDPTFKFSTIQALAGAIAGGGKAGAGAALAVNYLSIHDLAGINGSEVTSTSGDIIIISASESSILAVSAGIAGSGKVAFAGSVTVNFIRNDIHSFIKDSTVISGNTSTAVQEGHYPGVNIYAADNSNISSFSGQVNFADTAGIGAAAAYNDISNGVKAYIGGENPNTVTKVTSESYLTITTLSQATITSLAVGGGAGGKFAGNGSIAINTIRNDVAAYIINADVKAQNDIRLTASDKSQIGAIAGAVGMSETVAIGGSVAINFIGVSNVLLGAHQVQVFIDNSKVVSENGAIALKALSDTVIKSLSVSGGLAGKVAVNGAVSFNWIYTDVAAYIKNCTSMDNSRFIKAKGNITLDAVDNSAVSVIAGDISGGATAAAGASVALVFIGAGGVDLSEFINGLLLNQAFGENEYPYDKNGENKSGSYQGGVSDEDYKYPEPKFSKPGQIRTYIYNSTVTSADGSVKLTTTVSAIFNISAGLAVGGKAGAYRGSLALNYINNEALARIDNATVNAAQDVILIVSNAKRDWLPQGALQVEWSNEKATAFKRGGALETGEEPIKFTSIKAIAGGVSGGLNAGLGAALAVNHIQNNFASQIINSTVTAGGAVQLVAECAAGIETISAAIAAAAGDSLTSFPVAAAGSLSLNTINNSISSNISNSTINAVNVYILAGDTSYINSISGQIGVSGGIIMVGPVPVPSGAAVGVAAAYNNINNTVKSFIDNNSNVTASNNLIIQAFSKSNIATIAAGSSISGMVGISGTVTLNMITGKVAAYIEKSTVTAGNNIYLLAQADSTIGSYGGTLGGGMIGTGAAAVVNIINKTTLAYISDAAVIAKGNGSAINVLKWDEAGNKSNEDVRGLIIIAHSLDKVTLYTGALGIGGLGVGGEVAASSLNNTTQAYITKSAINNAGDWGKGVIIRAHEDTGIVVYAGGAAAGGTAVSGAVNVIDVGHITGAYVDNNSKIYALDGISLWASTNYGPLTEDNPSIIIGGASLGFSYALAGAVSVVTMHNVNEAFVKDSTLYSRGTINIDSIHNMKLSTITATVSGGGFAGAGGGIFVNLIENQVRAYGENAALNAQEAIAIMAKSRDNIDIIVGTGSAGVVGGVAGAVSISLLENLTEAYFKGEINQDSRFKPGGSYAPTGTQTILILADNKTNIHNIDGAVGIGAALGVGAALDLISIQNRTIATIKNGSKVYAQGDITIKAIAEKNIDSAVFSAGGGGLFGLSGAISLVIIGSSIDADGRAEFNTALLNQIIADTSLSNLFYTKNNKDEQVCLLPTYIDNINAISSKFNNDSSKNAKINAALNTSTNRSDKVTQAAVENASGANTRAEIISQGKVVIAALSTNNINVTTNNAALAGVAVAGGTLGKVIDADTTKAFLGSFTYVRAQNLAIKAEAINKTKVLSQAASGTLGVGTHAYVAEARVKPLIEAYIGNNADIAVTKEISIDADATPQVSTEVKSADLGGVGTIGASIAKSIVEPQVTAWIGDNVRALATISGNPTLTLLDKAELTGNPNLEFRGYTIRIEGDLVFTRGIAMSGNPDLVFSGSTITRKDNGSWLTDGFTAGKTIIISGTRYNDGQYVIETISIDGKVLTLQVNLQPETIDKNAMKKNMAGEFVLKSELVIEEGVVGFKVTLQRNDSLSWEEARLGDYIYTDIGGLFGGKLYGRIIEINGNQLTLDMPGMLPVGETNISAITMELLPGEVMIRAAGDQGHDQIVFSSGGIPIEGVANSRGDKIAVGDYITIITPNMGINTGIYKIIGFSGNRAILDTLGQVTSGTINNTVISKVIPSEITRSEGDWRADGFASGQIINISGAQNSMNNGEFGVLKISEDGKTLFIYNGWELAHEDISAANVTINANTPDQILRDEGSWADDGFAPGQMIRLNGSSQGNDGVYTIAGISSDGKVLILTSKQFKKETSPNLIVSLLEKHEAQISIKARVNLPESGKTAQAKAAGISGSVLFSGSGVVALAEVNPIIKAFIGQNSNLEVDGKLEVLVQTNTNQEASTNTINMGLIAATVNSATSWSNSDTSAVIGADSQVRAHEVSVRAAGVEMSYAEAISGSGGLISGSFTEAKTNNKSDTRAAVDGSTINADGFSLQAEHTALYNSRVDTFSAAVLNGSAGKASNNADATVKAQIGANSKINAADILILSNNYSVKDWLNGDTPNVKAGSGGGLNVPAAYSDTTINHHTIIEILDAAQLNLLSNPLYLGNMNLSAYNHLLIRDKVKLDAAGEITWAVAKSNIVATEKAQIIIANQAKLNSEEDINISAHALADIESQVDINVTGTAARAGGESNAIVNNENRITIKPAAVLFAEGTISLLAGKNIFDHENNLKMKLNSVIINNGIVPVTSPNSEGYLNLNNYITIGAGSTVKSGGDINLMTETGVMVAEAKITGTDWVKSALGAEIKGGTGKHNVEAIIRIDGNVEAGLRNQQILIIDANGNIVQKSEGITITDKKELLHNYILDEIRMLQSLAAQYAGTEAGEAFKAQIGFLERELQLMGYNASGQPVPVWIDIIVVGNIKAQQPNINIIAEDGSLIGSGVINASASPPLIKIENHSSRYLELGYLIIPEGEGGRLYFNYGSVTNNNDINSRNIQKNQAGFSITTGGSGSSEPPKIYIENTSSSKPDIRIVGGIRNIGSPTKAGVVTIKSTGSVVAYGSLEAGDLSIAASGNFSQSYTDTFFNVGGSPRTIWGEFVRNYTEGQEAGYPYRLVKVPDELLPDLFPWVYKLEWQRISDYDDEIQEVLSKPVLNRIKAENIFIAARYLNINGTIEAGGSEYEIIFDGVDTIQILGYKTAYSWGLKSSNYKDYPLHSRDSGYYYYYDPVAQTIILEPIINRGGYIELFGQIISTGNGKIQALDGYGSIKIDNRTDYDVIIKGLDTGIGSKGVVVITDTSKKKPGTENVYLTTKYEREGNVVRVTTWYTDDKGNIVSDSTVNQNEAYYQPTEGWRFDWVMGQSISERRVELYCSKVWIADWLARDPKDKISEEYFPVGDPRLLPEGEYLRYSPSEADEPYIYRYASHVLDDSYWQAGNPKKREQWWTQSWFAAPIYYYTRDTYERGSLEVYYHSIKADYPIKIEFGGNPQGTVSIKSKGNIIFEGGIKNELGQTSIESEKGIYYHTSAPIISKKIDLVAHDGIGINSPVVVEVGEGALSAKTTAGDINIKEIKGTLVIREISSGNGNIRLEAQAGIENATAESIIKGNLIELFTLYGELGSRSPLRIQDSSGSRSGAKVSALAQGDIHLNSIKGDLRVISIVSTSGDLHIQVLENEGRLLDGNPDKFKGNDGLLALWNTYFEGKTVNTAEIYAFLEAVRFKALSNTNYWDNDLDLSGKNIYLWVKGDIGHQEEFRINLTGSELSEEMRTILAGARPEDVSFYDANGQPIDPQSGGQAAYLLVKIYRPLSVNADGLINATSTNGDIYLSAPEDLNIGTINTGGEKDIIIKAQGGTYNKALVEGAANVIGLYILLEAADGSLGSDTKPLIIQPRHSLGVTLLARSGNNIYLENIGNQYNYPLFIDYIYAPGQVSIKSAREGIRPVDDSSTTRIVAGSLNLEATYIGLINNLLKVRLFPLGVLNAKATGGNIYLQGLEGDLNLDLIESNGEVHLKARGSILDGRTEGEGGANIIGKGITLEALEGNIGSNGRFLKVTTLAGGSLSANTNNTDIFIRGLTDDLSIKAIDTGTGNVTLRADKSIIDYLNNDLANIIGKNITLTADNGSLGSSGNFLDLAASGVLNATATNGNIYLAVVPGNMNVDKVNASGDVHLKARGSILDGRTEGENGANIIGKNITLETTNGDIGSNEKFLKVTTLTGGSLTANANNTDIFIRGLTNDLSIRTIDAGTGNVTLRADKSIIDYLNNDAANIIGKNMTLTVDTGTLGAENNFLDLAASGVLNATATNGNIYLAAVQGDMNVDSVNADGDIYLTAKNSITDGNDNPTGLNIIGRNITLKTLEGNIGEEDKYLKIKLLPEGGLQANTIDGGIWLKSNGHLKIKEIIAQGLVNLEATKGITVEGNISSPRPIVLTARDSADTGDDIVIMAGSVISSNGFITLQAGDNLIVQNGALLEASGKVTIYIDYGYADVETGGILELYGGVKAAALNLEGNSDDNTFIINSNSIETDTTINGYAGNDTFNLIQISSDLTVNGGEDDDVFNIQFTGPVTGMVILNGDDGNDTFNLIQISSNLTVNGGLGDDVFNIQFTGPMTGMVILNGDAGNDTFCFADGAILNGEVNGGSGNDILDFSAYSSGRDIRITGYDNDGYKGSQEAISNGFFAGINILKGNDGDKLFGINNKSGEWFLDGNASYYKAKDANVTLNFINCNGLYASDVGDTFVIAGLETADLYGGAGNDTFILQDGAKLNGQIDGGLGNNTLDYRLYTTGIRVNLAEGEADHITDAIAGIHNVYGGLGDDTIIGDDNDNILGSSGGEDTLIGGGGNNTYLFFDGFDLVHIILGESGQDRLDFSNIAKDLHFALAEGLVTYEKNSSTEGRVEYDSEDNFRAIIGGSGDNIFIIADGFVLPGGTVIDGGTGNSTLDLSAYESSVNAVLTGAGVNGYTGEQAAIPAGFVNINRIISSLTAENTLQGANIDSIYTLGKVYDTDADEYLDFHTVTVNGIVLIFENYHNLIGGNADNNYLISDPQKMNITGGSGNDTFKFDEDSSLEGIIDGGAGYNTIDYSAYNAAIIFNLEAMSATGLAKFSHINKFVGSNENDTIIAADSDTRLEINGENTGRLIWNISTEPHNEWTIDFVGIENLRGGTGDDTFTLIGSGSLSGSIDGGAGSNTLDYSKYDIGDNTGVKADLSSEELAATAIGNGEKGRVNNINNLVSSPYDDEFTGHESENNTFIFLDNWGKDTANPGGGLNTLDFSNMTQSLTITLDGNKEEIDDETIYHYLIKVTGTPDNSITIAWKGENDLIQTIYGSQGENKYYINYDYKSTLYGGEGDDSFFLNGDAKLNGKIDGLGGRNTLDFSSYSSGRDIILKELGILSGFNGSENSLTEGFYNINTLVGSGTDGDGLTGADVNSTYLLEAAFEDDDIWNKYYLNQDDSIILIFAGFKALHGGNADDTFKISGQQPYDLYGGAGNDNFIFVDKAALIGNIDGQAGINTLDYSAYTSPREFYLKGIGSLAGFDGVEASIDRQFCNIGRIIGNAGLSGDDVFDSLFGLNEDAIWRIGGPNNGSYQSGEVILTFTAIGNLNGGDGNDSFCFNDDALIGGNLDGGGGNDTLNYSACRQGITVNLAESEASYIIGRISSVENVTGGRGNDTLIGDDQDNILDGGSGDDYLDGGAGNDTLITGSGFNTLIGGGGTDTAVVDFGSTYKAPRDDIEKWIFLQPPPGPGGGSGGGSGGMPDKNTNSDKEKQTAVDNNTGGVITGNGVSIIVPPGTFADDVTLTIKELELQEIQKFVSGGLILKIGSSLFEITSSGQSYFGWDNYITIKIPFDPDKISTNEEAIAHYYDTKLGKWVPVKTKYEFDQEKGQWLAVIKVNHLTLFAVFSTKVERELISFTIGALNATVGSVAHILDVAPTIDSATGRTLIPVRFLAEALGAKVEWIASTQKVIITDGDRRIVLTIGSPEVLVDGERVTIDVAPGISPAGRTMIPLRFICEALGSQVEYNHSTRQIAIVRKYLN